MVKILKVEDLKNDDIVARIKKELSSQLTFSKGESSPASQKSVSQEVSLLKCEKNVKKDPEPVSDPLANSNASQKPKTVPATPKFIVLSKKVSEERMKRFLSMTPEDVQPKNKKKYKCEMALSEFKKPVDTIRCVQCGVLYERDIYKAHIKVCKGNKVRAKFGCTLCSFTDYSFKELEAHLRNHHPNKK